MRLRQKGNPHEHNMTLGSSSRSRSGGGGEKQPINEDEKTINKKHRRGTRSEMQPKKQRET